MKITTDKNKTENKVDTIQSIHPSQPFRFVTSPDGVPDNQIYIRVVLSFALVINSGVQYLVVDLEKGTVIAANAKEKVILLDYEFTIKGDKES